MEGLRTVSAEGGQTNGTDLLWGFGATCMPRYITPGRCWDEGRFWDKGGPRIEIEATGKCWGIEANGEK